MTGFGPGNWKKWHWHWNSTRKGRIMICITFVVKLIQFCYRYFLNHGFYAQKYSNFVFIWLFDINLFGLMRTVFLYIVHPPILIVCIFWYLIAFLSFSHELFVFRTSLNQCHFCLLSINCYRERRLATSVNNGYLINLMEFHAFHECRGVFLWKESTKRNTFFQMWTDFWTNDETIFVHAAHEIQNYSPMKFPMRIPFNRKSNQRNFSAWIPQNSQKTSIFSTFFFRKNHNNNKLCVHGNHEKYRQRIHFKWLHRQSALKCIRKMPAIK